MKLFKVQNLLGQITHAAKFNTEEEGSLWVEKNKKAFGKQDRWLEPSEFDGEQSQDATDSREKIKLGDITVIEYFFPANYEVVIEDITDRIEEENQFYKALDDVKNAPAIIAKIKVINLRKKLTFQGLQALMADQNLVFIKELIRDGSIATALAVIKQTNTNLFTADEKAEIISFIETLGYK